MDINEMRQQAAAIERERCTEIDQIAQRASSVYPRARELADRAIREGVSLADFQRQLYQSGAGTVPAGQKPIGMSERDVNRYSLLKAIRERMDGKDLTGLEREVSDECRRGLTPDSKACIRHADFSVPLDIIAPNIRAGELVAGTGSLGGHIVADELHAMSFIDILRSKMLISELGALHLDGLQGDVLIPRKATSGTAYWGTEIAAATQSNPTFDQLSLTPKAITGFQTFSRQLLIQSTPSAERLVRADLAAGLAQAIDTAAISGATGGANPVGILNTTGVGLITIAANGSSLTVANGWPNIVGIETEVAIDNADAGAMAYLTNAKVRGALKVTERVSATGQFCWGDLIIEKPGANPVSNGSARLNGYPVGVSNNVPATMTQGTSTTVCSPLIFGNFNDVVIASWGSLDVTIDPFSLASTRIVRVFATRFVDVGIRHPQSFAYLAGILA